MGQVVVYDGISDGVGNGISSAEVSLSPNPVSDVMNVSIDGNHDPYESINICDVLGKVVYTKRLNHTTGDFDIITSAFSQGIFQVQLLGENISVTKSIIIQK